MRSSGPINLLAQRLAIVLLAFGLSLHAVAAQGKDQNGSGQTGAVTGRVVHGRSGDALPGAVIAILGTQRGSWTGPEGAFLVEDLPPGNYTIECTYVGFETRQVSVTIEAGELARIEVTLIAKPIELSAMTVTPSRFAIMGQESHARQALTEEEIQTISHLGEDIYRAVARLPGISSSDFSAKFTVRGGEHEEVLVLLDGLELYDAFHLKDIQGGALSIVDVATIEGIDLLTGGFPAEYGNRTSGVFNIVTKTPRTASAQHSVGISFMNARLMSEGIFDRGSWLLSARRGYLDLVLSLMNEEESIDPSYYDILCKVEYDLNPNHTLSAHVLHARDDLLLVEDDEDVDETGYGNSYGWLNLKSALGSRMFVRSTFSTGKVTHDRLGTAFQGDRVSPDFTVDDNRSFTFAGLKQDWDYELSDDHYLKWGLDLKRQWASYDYLSANTWYGFAAPDTPVSGTDTTAIEMDPTGSRIGLYGADRFRVTEPLAVEIGLRYDATSYTDDNLVSPRLNFVYSIGQRTSLRGGWGRYYQSQGIHELRVYDGEASFRPAVLARHWVLGLEHYFASEVHLRLEAYHKRLTDQHPAYRNWLNEIEPFPEMQPDRFRVELDETKSRGVELYLKKEGGGTFTWWATYALAEVEEDVNRVTVGADTQPFGRSLPGVYDQRHTVYFDLNYRPNPRWRLNVAWQYRSGWPYTEQILLKEAWEDGTPFYHTTAGVPHGSRYPSFHRGDLRLSRHFETSRGHVKTFLEVINLYNRGNVQTYVYDWVAEENGDLRLEPVPDYWFRLLPSIGVSWSWGS